MPKIKQTEYCIYKDCKTERKGQPTLYIPSGVSYYIQSPIYIYNDGSVRLTCSHVENLPRFVDMRRLNDTIKIKKEKRGRQKGRTKYCQIHGLSCGELSTGTQQMFKFEITYGRRKENGELISGA